MDFSAVLLNTEDSFFASVRRNERTTERKQIFLEKKKYYL